MNLNLDPKPASFDDRLVICDCDGVLIDSEAVAARMLVQELQARWPDVDVEPVVLPLLGLRIEAVLASTARHARHETIDAAEIDAIRRAVEAAAVQAPAVDGHRRSACGDPARARRARATVSRRMSRPC